jgi:hypothetical protein
MTARLLSRVTHPATFLVAASAIYVCSILIVGQLPRLQDADALAVGVTCDLVLLVPALYYLLLVRGRGWPALGLAPVFVISLVAASRILPAEHHRLLSALELAAVPVELGLLGWIGWRAVALTRRLRSRRRTADDDAFAAIRRASREAIGSSWVAELFAQEIATFYYALCSWRTPLPDAKRGFTSYRKNSYGVFLSAIVIVLVVETVAVHLLIHTLWSSVAAWTLTAFSLYGLLWMIGDFQALRLRTTSVAADRIDIRLGTRWEVTIPRDAVTSVQSFGQPVDADCTSARAAEDKSAKPVDLVLFGTPDVEIRLSRPVTARGLFGLRRTATTIRLQIDDPEGFIAHLLPDHQR